MTVEDLLDECGGFGKYQVLIIFGIFIHKILAGWSMMQMSYAGYSPNWHCEVNDGGSANNSTTLNKCSLNNSDTGFQEQSCHSYRFDGPSTTVITEWDLVCDKKWVKATITSIQMAGVLVGAVLSGQSADYFGRKKSLFGFALLQNLLNFVVIFSPSWEIFAVFRFFIGVGIGAVLVITLPYALEFMPTKWRPLMSIVPHWPIGVSLFALAALILDNWVHLHIAVGVLGIPSLLGCFYVPESVRWLTLKGRYREAEKIFEKIAAVNGKAPPKETRYVLEKVYQEEQDLKSSETEYTYWNLFKEWQMAKMSLILCYVWFMLSMVFYGISFGVSALSGNLYLNIFLVAIVEVPINLSTFYFNNRFGRKITFITLLGLGTICACSCLVVKLAVSSDEQGRLIRGLSIASKVALGASWTVSQTWASELYPTVVRSLGYGLVNTAARLGGIVAPFAVDFDNRPLLAYAIITGMAVVAMFVSFFLNDTVGKVLSDSITNTPTSPVGYGSTTEMESVVRSRSDGLGPQDENSKKNGVGGDGDSNKDIEPKY